MTAEEVCNVIENRYDGIVKRVAYGETTFFYNPDGILKNGVYFCTIKEKDGPNDKSSNLSREGIYRISTGITKEIYIQLFSEIPKRPVKGGIIDVNVDFSKTNIITEHPIYGWMSWINVLSPDENVFNEFIKYVDVSYKKAVGKYKKRIEEVK